MCRGNKIKHPKNVNTVPPGVKSAEAAELGFSCVESNVNRHPPGMGSAVAAHTVWFAQRNWLHPLAAVRGTYPVRPLHPLLVGLGTCSYPCVTHDLQ